MLSTILSITLLLFQGYISFHFLDIDLATGSKNREVFHNPKLISRVLNCVNNV
jgi:hypothetical protein